MLGALVLYLSTAVFAQQASSRVSDVNTHAWFMYFGDHKVSAKWGVHLEGQLRRSDEGTAMQQLLLRPAVNYHLHPNVMLTAGYGYIRTYPYGDNPAATTFPEHRFYQQALIRQPLGKVTLQHRYRLEQRFIGVTSPSTPGSSEVSSWRAQDRFRYMVRADLPIKGRWSMAAYDEFFVNFGRNLGPNQFDQNRAYVAVGYTTGKLGRLEVGYMNQYLAQRTGRVVETNHTVQVGFYSSFPFRKR